MTTAISDMKIEKFTPSDYDIIKYIEVQRNDTAAASLTLNQYLKEQYFKNTNVIVTADLSNKEFNGKDLSKGDFTGCIFKNTTFKNAI